MFLQKGIVFVLDFFAFALIGLWLYLTRTEGANSMDNIFVFVFIPTLLIKYLVNVVLFLTTKKIKPFIIMGGVFICFFSLLTYPFNFSDFNPAKTQLYFWLTFFFNALVFAGYAYTLKSLKSEIFF